MPTITLFLLSISVCFWKQISNIHFEYSKIRLNIRRFVYKVRVKIPLETTYWCVIGQFESINQSGQIWSCRFQTGHESCKRIFEYLFEYSNIQMEVWKFSEALGNSISRCDMMIGQHQGNARNWRNYNEKLNAIWLPVCGWEQFEVWEVILCCKFNAIGILSCLIK